MKKTEEKRQKKDDDTKLFAFLAVFLSIIGFIIALLAKKENRYVMFYAKQSLVLFLSYIIVYATQIIPLIGKIIFTAGFVIMIILWIIALINSFSGEEKETPLIGQYARKINL